ncbi:MAG: hypothetical protein HY056_17595 [Proteobacteria bacterium]|nr:hypothetical protein [Pseudomonadota bacterium]
MRDPIPGIGATFSDAVSLRRVELALCAGAESMSRNPDAAYTHRGGFRMGQVEFKDFLRKALNDPVAEMSMDDTAEDRARQYQITRGEVETYAARGFARALAAQQSGFLAGEIAPVPAIRSVLARARLTLADIDRFEINEAFGAQVMACARALGIDEEKLNVNGGAIAIGHPLGATGVRLTLTLARELRRAGRRYGIASACVGGGQGIAVLIENPQAAPSAQRKS